MPDIRADTFFCYATPMHFVYYLMTGICRVQLLELRFLIFDFRFSNSRIRGSLHYLSQCKSLGTYPISQLPKSSFGVFVLDMLRYLVHMLD